MSGLAPIAPARLEHHPHGSIWLVVDCPLCHRVHRHGGGRDDNPRDFLGLRRPLCVPGDVPPDVEFPQGDVLMEAQP